MDSKFFGYLSGFFVIHSILQHPIHLTKSFLPHSCSKVTYYLTPSPRSQYQEELESSICLFLSALTMHSTHPWFGSLQAEITWNKLHNLALPFYLFLLLSSTIPPIIFSLSSLTIFQNFVFLFFSIFYPILNGDHPWLLGRVLQSFGRSDVASETGSIFRTL